MRVALFALVLTGLWAGCEAVAGGLVELHWELSSPSRGIVGGSYAAVWTLADETLICAGADPALLAEARCGRFGIDAIKIETIDAMGFQADVSIFACGRCTPSRGPSLEAGIYLLRATPLGTDL